MAHKDEKSGSVIKVTLAVIAVAIFLSWIVPAPPKEVIETALERLEPHN